MNGKQHFTLPVDTEYTVMPYGSTKPSVLDTLLFNTQHSSYSKISGGLYNLCSPISIDVMTDLLNSGGFTTIH